jgi:hypothetical protein
LSWRKPVDLLLCPVLSRKVLIRPATPENRSLAWGELKRIENIWQARIADSD